MSSRSVYETAQALARSARELPAATARPVLSPPRCVGKRARGDDEKEADTDAASAGVPPSSSSEQQLPRRPLPPATFYTPATSAVSLSAVERGLLRLLTAVDARLRSEKGTLISSAAPPYLTFPRQAPAFEAADAAPPAAGLRVFSIEAAPASAGGGRAYVVTTLPELWRRYRSAPPADRRHYEILREGRPVHLYLDIEFKRVGPGGVEVNACVDGDALVDAAVAGVAARLAADHGVAVAPGDVLELDASSPSKFSRHVTIRVAGVAFASTQDVGALVRAALADPLPAWSLSTGHAPLPPPPPSSPPLLPSVPAAHVDDAFMVASGKADGAARVPAIDLGVYTRNRAWRMAGSAKAGDPERRVLVPLGRFGDGGVPSDRAAFFAGLAGEVGPGVRLIVRPDAVGPGAGGRVRGNGGGSTSSTSAPSSSSSSSSIRPGPSPVPVLDAFISEIAFRDSGGVGGPVSVRAWGVWAGEAAPGGGLLLALRGGRFCGRIGRPHASNGVFYIVDAAAGHYVQRCYDPECRGFRSPARPLPGDVWRAAAATLPGLVGVGAGAAAVVDKENDAHAAFMADDGLDEAAAVAAVAAAEAARAMARGGG